MRSASHAPPRPPAWQVLAPKPVAVERSTTERLSTFLQPFSASLWLMTICFVVRQGPLPAHSMLGRLQGSLQGGREGGGTSHTCARRRRRLPAHPLELRRLLRARAHLPPSHAVPPQHRLSRGSR